MGNEVGNKIVRIKLKVKDEVIPDEAALQEFLALRVLNQKLPTEFSQVDVQWSYRGVNRTAIRDLLREAALPNGEKAVPNIWAYLTLRLPGEQPDVAGLLRALKRLELTGWAYIDPDGKEPRHRLDPRHEPFFPVQAYLKANGIDVVDAWPKANGSGTRGFAGSGMRIADVERGWDLDFPELPDLPRLEPPEAVMIEDPATRAHGTQVLGIVAAQLNASSSIGIAFEVGRVHIVSYAFPGGDERRAAAIAHAATLVGQGDVILIEIELDEPEEPPVEVLPEEFAAIRVATLAGRVVVEAAGNKGTDLDRYIVEGRHVLNIEHPKFEDSGAIMVAGADPATRKPAHNPSNPRDIETNFGSRIDCFAWGRSVRIFVDASAEGFGGTSAASAIIAGAALVVQGAARCKRGNPLPPLELRRVLKDPPTSTPSADPADRIGRMPSVSRIVASL